MKKACTERSRSGFTLIELLVVISIVAVLSTVGLTIFSGIQSKARDSNRKSDLRILAIALELYYQKNGKYQPSQFDQLLCDKRDITYFYNTIYYYFSGKSYDVKDPLTSNLYCYLSDNKGTFYRLYAKLENCQDPQIIPGINCQTAEYNYSLASEGTTVIAYASPFQSSSDSSSGSSGGGSNPAKKIFLTSTVYNGNLGGLSGADQKCQSLATAANLPGSWKAWLSTDTISAANRLTHSESGYRLLDDSLVANNWADLTDGTIVNGISQTEKRTILVNQPVLTATTPSGTSNGMNCNNWQTASGYTVCGISGSGSSGGSWTNYSASCQCSANAFGLYCFEQ